MELAELCWHLRQRRTMYVGDDRFLTMVASVEGFDAALDADPLSGFQDYVLARILGHHSSLHWSVVIASTERPGVLTTSTNLNDLPLDVQSRLTHLLLGLLDDFNRQRSANR